MRKLAKTLSRSRKNLLSEDDREPLKRQATSKQKKKKKKDRNRDNEESKPKVVIPPPKGIPPRLLKKKKEAHRLMDPINNLSRVELNKLDHEEAVNLRVTLLGSDHACDQTHDDLAQEAELKLLDRWLNKNKLLSLLLSGRINKEPTNERWLLVVEEASELKWIRILSTEDKRKIDSIIDEISSMSETDTKEALKSCFEFDDSEILAFSESVQRKKEDLLEELQIQLACLVIQDWLLISRGFVFKQDDQMPAFVWAGAFFCKPETLTEYGLDDLHLTSSEILKLRSLAFSERVEWLRSQFEHMGFEDAEEGPIKVSIQRENVLGTIANNFNALHEYDRWRLGKYAFVGEPALDSGGVAKEVFRIVSEAIFQEQFGLFQRCGGKDGEIAYDINPNSGLLQPDRHLLYFRFAGRFLARALLEGCFINISICKVLYKHILGRPLSYHDLIHIDKEIYNSIKYLVDEASSEDLKDLDQRFVVSEESFGEIKEIELCPDGANEVVTKQNLAHYVYLLTKYYLHDRYKPQLYSFMQGFHAILPYHLFFPFSVEEFEKLVIGENDIDIEDFKANVSYAGLFSEEKENHQVIKWFWEVVSERFSNEERRKLIQFFTGSSRLPVGGFSALHQGKEERRIVFKGIRTSVSVYPRAHTCFNHLDLPLYDKIEELETRLKESINFNIGFNMD